MKENKESPQFKKHIFVCTRCKHDDHCNDDSYAAELRSELKSVCKENFSKADIRINASGCLGVCSEGIHMVIYPDNKWFKKVQKEDIPTIVEYIKSST
jgi:(2Fe-2S) ferredoxin